MKSLLSVLVIVLPVMLHADDFTSALDAYEKGNYVLAQAYYKYFLDTSPMDPRVDDALYYLIKIYDAREDRVNFLSAAYRFLTTHAHDARCQEVYNCLLDKLVEGHAYVLAYEYVQRFDYFDPDSATLTDVALGLYACGIDSCAASALKQCAQGDTVLLLRALLSLDPEEKKALYKEIDDMKGQVYLAEYLLAQADTIGAYDVFTTIESSDMSIALKYRYLKLCRLYDQDIYAEISEELRTASAYRNKVELLQACDRGARPRMIQPADSEEYVLYVQCMQQDTIARFLPEEISADSIDFDTLDSGTLRLLRQSFEDNYYLDSAYVEQLIIEKRYDEAWSIMSAYIDYANTVAFARSVCALHNWAAGDYERAGVNILLCQNDTPLMQFVLADAFQQCGKDAQALYKAVFETTKDSLLRADAAQRRAVLLFHDGQYKDLASIPFEYLEDNNECVEYCLYSLARVGDLGLSDSLHSVLFGGGSDSRILDGYGEYLIERKKLQQAASLYDSLVIYSEGAVDPSIYYNYCLVPFMAGDLDTAQVRLRHFIAHYQNSTQYPAALFKLATIYYFDQKFDSAGYFYGMASADDELRMDALENQLICYKKAGDWKKTIDAGKELLTHAPSGEHADALFEVGYAYLRSGNARQAVKYLSKAVQDTVTPEYLYWLGEVYLGKGDFLRALYHYQKIIRLFPKDEMWTPTAHYKVGIVYEFMDEIGEAQKVYHDIIQRRGVGDPWGMEAQRRLEELE
jgi:TolA-binding protein